MIGQLYIDGKDAHSIYGVFLLKGSYALLIGYPPLKKVATNDWQEVDGIEVDLSAPVLDTREFTLKFAAHNKPKVNDLLVALSQGAYHTFEFRELGRTYKLRLVSMPGREIWRNTELFSLQFSDDFPLLDYVYLSPIPLVNAGREGYKLDGKPFSAYGVHVLKGADEIAKSTAVKKNLLRNINSQSGVIYDGHAVTYQSGDVKINCFMRPETVAEFWRNYNALLYDLTRPGERLLYCEATGKQYPCHYKSATVSDFTLSDRVWCEFAITLTVIAPGVTPKI
ncbi:MAG: hypothetical protein RSC12_01490 [Alistipes sp.]